MADKVDGFAPRRVQQEMSEAVAEALQDNGILLVEAGTGVGKTFAYLVPALLSGRKIIISTGTRHLQDQLFHRDLPLVRRSLGISADIALLKGRRNYLCLYRLQNAAVSMSDRMQASQLQSIRSWSGITKQGDIAELADVPESAPVWAKATSTAENCLGTDCPEFNHCHLVRARRRAQEADIVVVNHHLFFADMALKEEGFGEVLPSADAFILDEAHQLPETASRFFGRTVSGRQFEEFANDSIAAQLEEAPDRPGLREIAQSLLQEVGRYRLALGTAEVRMAWQTQVHNPALKSALAGLRDALDAMRDELAEVAGCGEALSRCAERCEALSACLSLFEQQESNDLILWYETMQNGFRMHATPPEVGEIFQEYMQAYQAAWVFTSATLSVAGRFDHFQRRMGLAESRGLQLDSPFDYRNNALLYLPKNMPEPKADHFLDRLIEVSLPVLEASRGRAFMLFTSYRALQYVADHIHSRLDYPLLVQGEAPRSQLLDRFRLSDGAVLLGTSSFWEGVDIKGEALSCVIIDKLPFAAPGDPVLQARLNRLRQQGGNPFFDLQLPQAVIALKQGVGRLIRGVEDRGVLMIADPRIRGRAYGKLFLDSLPAMPVVDDIEEVTRFFGRAG